MITLGITNTFAPPHSLIDDALDIAIREDLGCLDQRDITSSALVAGERVATGSLYCKQPGVIAGLDIFTYALKKFDRRISVTPTVSEGEWVDQAAQCIATFRGPALSLLSGERLALNLLQRMSGIATVTKKYVDLAHPFSIQIRDTRKTTPGLRIFERQAVAAAGGTNHRFGLFDAILIKDNHIKIAGGIEAAIDTLKNTHPDLPIEVEATSLHEVQAAVDRNVHTILLDNMNPTMVRRSLAIIQGRAFVEVSGGINLSNLKDYLIPGVNAISIGALTHSAPSVDISLEIESYL